MAAPTVMYEEPKTFADYLHVVGLNTPIKRVLHTSSVAAFVCYAARWPKQCFTSTGQFRKWDPRPQLHPHTEDEDADELPTQTLFFAVPIAVGVATYLFT